MRLFGPGTSGGLESVLPAAGPDSVAVGTDGSSGFLVVWPVSCPDPIDPQGILFGSDGTLRETLMPPTEPGPGEENCFHSPLAVGPSSGHGFVVAWSAGDVAHGPKGLWGRHYLPLSKAVEPTFWIDFPGQEVNPAVALNQAGNHILIWNAGNAQILGRSVGDSILGAVQTIADGMLRQNTAPKIATNETGAVLVVWDGPAPDDPQSILGRYYPQWPERPAGNVGFNRPYYLAGGITDCTHAIVVRGPGSDGDATVFVSGESHSSDFTGSACDGPSLSPNPLELQFPDGDASSREIFGHRVGNGVWLETDAQRELDKSAAGAVQTQGAFEPLWLLLFGVLAAWAGWRRRTSEKAALDAKGRKARI